MRKQAVQPRRALDYVAPQPASVWWRRAGLGVAAVTIGFTGMGVAPASAAERTGSAVGVAMSSADGCSNVGKRGVKHTSKNNDVQSPSQPRRAKDAQAALVAAQQRSSAGSPSSKTAVTTTAKRAATTSSSTSRSSERASLTTSSTSSASSTSSTKSTEASSSSTMAARAASASTVSTTSANQSSTGASLPIAEGSYSLSAHFGETGAWSRYHTGMDFSASTGTPVRAVVSGTVVSSSAGSWAGTHVVVRADDGSSTLYAHLSSKSVSVGDRVEAGEQIGRVGNTGRSFGSHLHLEYYKPGVTPGDVYSASNPQTYLKSLGLNI